jgi:hypothetical protein
MGDVGSALPAFKPAANTIRPELCRQGQQAPASPGAGAWWIQANNKAVASRKSRAAAAALFIRELAEGLMATSHLALLVLPNADPIARPSRALPSHVCELPADFGVISLARAQLAIGRLQPISLESVMVGNHVARVARLPTAAPRRSCSRTASP